MEENNINGIKYKLKNGDWGIAKIADYPVLPFYTHLGNTDDSLTIVRDVNTKLCGVISRKYVKEIIPCKYSFIEYGYSKKQLFFKVNKGGYLKQQKRMGGGVAQSVNDGLWGLYNENGDMIVGTRYYNIKFRESYFECCSTNDFLDEDYDYNEYGEILSYRQYIGKIDLYTLDGDFIVGGIDFVSYYSNYIILYMGIEYDQIKETKKHEFMPDYWDKVDMYHNIPLFKDSVCIMLDNQLKPVLKAKYKWLEMFRTGMSFKGKNDFCERLSCENIMKGCSVDMLAFNHDLLFLKFPNEQFLIPEYVPNMEETVLVDVFTAGQTRRIEFPNGKWEDRLIEDGVCVIVKLSKDGSVLWSHRVNEVGMHGYYTEITEMYYREGDKVGFFSENGFLGLKYSAISKDRQQNGNRVVAIKETASPIDFSSSINYYEIDENEELIKLDNKAFNPREFSWFPEYFQEDLYLDVDDYYEDDSSCCGGWTLQQLKEAADIAYEGYSPLELGLD